MIDCLSEIYYKNNQPISNIDKHFPIGCNRKLLQMEQNHIGLHTFLFWYDCVQHAYQNDSCDITKLLTPPYPLSHFVTNLVTPSPR